MLFWKLIVRGTDRVIAWVIPNSPEATQARLDAYLVSVQELNPEQAECSPRCQTMRSGRNPRYPGLCREGVTKDKRQKRGGERQGAHDGIPMTQAVRSSGLAS